MVICSSLELTPSNINHKNESKFKSCLKNIYDGEKKEFFYRNAASWRRILCYYAVFLTCIFGIFIAFLMLILYSIQQGQYPLYNKRSFRGYGVSFMDIAIFPMINPLNSLIETDTTKEQYLKYCYIIQEKLSKYKFEGVRRCDRNVESYLLNQSVRVSHKVKRDNQYAFQRMSLDQMSKPPCWFNVSTLGPCSVFPYGYDEGKPCIYLKINKVLNWNPTPYLRDSVLPKNMSNELISHIRNSFVPKIWASCEVTTPGFESDIGSFSYYPSQSFETFYFPYKKNPNYQSPLIAVQLNQIKKVNTEISLTCKLWVKDDFIFDRTFRIRMKTNRNIFNENENLNSFYLDYDIYVEKPSTHI